MTLSASTLPISPPRPPVVDLGSRLAHAGMAFTLLLSFLSSESEYWQLVHVYSGYTLAAVLVLRLIWGWVGPAPARWGVLLRRLGMGRMWWNKLKQGEWDTRPFWVGASSWLLSLAVFSIYAFCTVALASGWATYNEILGDGLLNDILQELHESLGNLAVAVTCIHVGLVVILRVWRGPQALRPMWRGYAHTSGRR